MKRRFALPFAALLVFAAPAVFAQAPMSQGTMGQGPRHGPPAAEMNERFERMDRMMEDAGRAHGEQRHQRLRQHMQQMQEQIQAMHGMMGPGMMGGGPQGGRMGPPDANDWQGMQERMDLMQRMMEQMMKQQQMMLEDENG